MVQEDGIRKRKGGCKQAGASRLDRRIDRPLALASQAKGVDTKGASSREEGGPTGTVLGRIAVAKMLPKCPEDFGRNGWRSQGPMPIWRSRTPGTPPPTPSVVVVICIARVAPSHLTTPFTYQRHLQVTQKRKRITIQISYASSGVEWRFSAYFS